MSGFLDSFGGAAISGAGSLAGSIVQSITNSASNAANINAMQNNIASQANYNQDFLRQEQIYGDQQRTDQEAFSNSVLAQQQAFDVQQQLQAEGYNAGQAAFQDQFQQEMLAAAQQYNTQMSNTAYQRGVADMRAAGINPILAAGQGAASSPVSPMAMGASGSVSPAVAGSGAGAGQAASPTASVGLASVPSRIPAQNILSGAINSALDAYKTSVAADQVQANIDNVNADTANKGAQGDLLRSQAANQDAETNLKILNSVTAIGGPAYQRAQIEEALSRAGLSDAEAEKVSQQVRFGTDFGPDNPSQALVAKLKTAVKALSTDPVASGGPIPSLTDVVNALKAARGNSAKSAAPSSPSMLPTPGQD